MQRELWGIPVWGWALGGVALLGGLVFFMRSSGNTKASSTQSPAIPFPYSNRGNSDSPPNPINPSNGPPPMTVVVTGMWSQSGGRTALLKGPSFDTPRGPILNAGDTVRVNPSMVPTADGKNWFYKIIEGPYKDWWIWAQDTSSFNGSANGNVQ